MNHGVNNHTDESDLTETLKCFIPSGVSRVTVLAVSITQYLFVCEAMSPKL